jgi:histidinol-phosphatase
MASRELEAALAAARAASEVIRAYYQQRPGVRLKSDASPVTEADERAEELIHATLSERFPAYGFWGEETGQHAMEAENVWLVDPIDGTKAFVRGIPFFSTQIALLRAGRLVLGVSSAPVYGELAWAEDGGGAWLNDRPVRVSTVAALAEAAVSTGNLRSLAGSPRWQRFGSLVGAAGYLRGYGDFVHYHLLSRGALDVVIESNVNILDIAALTVIVREAGGTFTDLDGRAVGPATTSVLATNGALHAEVLGILSS